MTDAAPQPTPLPYLTRDLPGIDGQVRCRLEDFRVEELPLYLPCGQGTHSYFRVTKAGVATPEAVARIARHMGVRPHDIGVAGLKDARAVTTQMMSLEHADERRLAAFRDAQVSLELLGRHGNKLRPGHLRANRFTLVIRGVGQAQLAAARAVLDVLVRRGVPDYFGPQRFGARGDTAELGAALVRDDMEQFVRLLLGRPRGGDPPDCKAARDAFDAGAYGRAMDLWPRRCVNERRALAAWRRAQRPAAAVREVDKAMKRLYVSALQSAVFNDVLAARIDTLDRVLVGDLAEKTDTGGVFYVEDADAEQPRADAFAISPTGVLVGYRVSLARARPGDIERQAIAAAGVSCDDFRRVGTLKVKGTRRALRFALADPDIRPGRDGHGEHLLLSYTAPSGCYATVLLREIMKTEKPEAAL